MAERLEDQGLLVREATVESLGRVAAVAPGLAETAAKTAIRLEERKASGPPDDAFKVAEMFSDSVRIQRRPHGWAVAAIDRLEECGELSWGVVS
jgi:hypothetical protein